MAQSVVGATYLKPGDSLEKSGSPAYLGTFAAARNSCFKDRTIVRVTFGFLLGLLSSGCAMIEEVQSDGTTRHSIFLAGPINGNSSPPDQDRIRRTIGVGISISDGAATIGYFNNTEIMLDPRCQIVLIGNTDKQLEQFASLIPDTQGICNETTSEGTKK